MNREIQEYDLTDNNNLENNNLEKKALSLLCPIRWMYNSSGKYLESLMIRRGFWNCEDKRPARSAGEWVFPGMLMEDPTQRYKLEYEYRVAYDAFVDDTGYTGGFRDTSFMHAGSSIRGGFDYSFKYFVSTLTKPDFPFANIHEHEREINSKDFGIFNLNESERIIEIRWDRPVNFKRIIAKPNLWNTNQQFSEDSEEYIRHISYVKEIEDHISFMGLDDSIYGEYCIRRRIMSKNTYRALSNLETIEKLDGIIPHM
jgi:hypothetical protein